MALPGQENALSMDLGFNKENSPDRDTGRDVPPERNLPDMHAVDQDVISEEFNLNSGTGSDLSDINTPNWEIQLFNSVIVSRPKQCCHQLSSGSWS